MKQRAAQASPPSINVNVVCPECGQTTRTPIHPDFITVPVDEDGAEYGTRCAWCRKSFNLVIFTEKQRRKA